MSHVRHVMFVVLILLMGISHCLYAQTTGTATNPKIVFGETGKVWTGAKSNLWSEPNNWRPSGVPTVGDKVFIPSGKSNYPKITSATTVAAIYIASGAALEGQHFLTAAEWYTTVNVPTNCWVSLCPQLQQIYSGDFFTAEQGGEYTAPFAPAVYNATEGNDGNNRVFPYAVYQRLFSTLVQDNTTGNYPIMSFNVGWSLPTNALNTKYQVGQGLQVWAPSSTDTTSFHFPSNATEYAWFKNDGTVAANMPAATVDHSNANQPAYQGEGAIGAMEVTLSRDVVNEAEATPMFAIGNPTFGYMNIAEFLEENSINKNTTPYLYAHTTSTNGQREGSETIYYFNHENQTLHTVTGSSETELPTGTPSSAIPNAYIKPGHSFRVMAGAAEVKCAEPALVGEYNCTSEMPDGLNTDKGTVQHYESFTYDTRNGKTATSRLSIAPGDNDHEVWLNNFVGQGSVKGYINTATQTITIKGGSQVNFNDRTWYHELTSGSGYQNPDSSSVWYIYAVDNNAAKKKISTTEHTFNYWESIFGRKESIHTQKASNVSKSNDIIIKYNVVGNTVNFRCENGFAIYPEDLTIFRNSNNVWGNFSSTAFCAAWNCYDSYTGSRTVTKGSTQYANSNIFGQYRYTISGTDGSGVPSKNTNVTFVIKPIAGLYNIVEISGIHPNAPTQSVIGIVNGNDIEIPAGQCVKTGTDIRNDYFYIYGWNSKRIAFTMTYTNNTIKFTQRLQVSPLNSQEPQYYTNNNFQCTHTGNWDGTTSGSTVITIGSNHSRIHIRYLAKMFTANPAASAPQHTLGQHTSNVVGISAAQGDALVNTIVVKSAKGNNGFSYLEDAAMMDINNEAFTLATIASDKIVAINTINDTTSLQLFLQNGNGTIELTISNAQALGNNVHLYDSANDTYTPLQGTIDAIVVTMGVNDSPLRYSLVWDAPIIADNEFPITDIDVDVYTPQVGTIQVVSDHDMTNVNIYNAAGVLVAHRSSVGQATQFNNLMTGIYMVEITTNNAKVVKKIDIK